MLTGCSSSAGGYRILETYDSEGGYVIAFRQGDGLCDLVSAAMKELAANGTLRTASLNWFGEDLISLKGQQGAVTEYGYSSETRILTIGINTNAKPLSYEEYGEYRGFDVDVANYICGYLGWSMVIRPIGVDEIGVQLASGNIDCAMGVPVSETGGSYSYSPEYLSGKYVLVGHSSGPGSAARLKGKTLGVTTADIDVLNKNEKFVSRLGSIIYQTSTDSLFSALSTGQVDAILVCSSVAAYYMR